MHRVISAEIEGGATQGTGEEGHLNGTEEEGKGGERILFSKPQAARRSRLFRLAKRVKTVLAG